VNVFQSCLFDVSSELLEVCCEMYCGGGLTNLNHFTPSSSFMPFALTPHANLYHLTCAVSFSV
jgi:hypothetical protein